MFATLLITAALAWVDADALTHDLRPSSRSTLEGTVTQMIDLLEQREYRKLLEEYGHPDTIADTKNERMFEMIVQMMAEAALGDELLAALKQFDLEKARFNADRSEAVFDVPRPGKQITKLTFARHEGIWYVKD